MRFAFVQAEKATYPVRALCRNLEVSPSGFYAWRKRAPSARLKRDEALKVSIRAFHAASRRTYGSPRIHCDLREAKERVGRKRVARLMREEGLQARRKRRFRVTTDSNHSEPIARNVLARDFAADNRNERWVTDITYVWTREGWLYVAVVVDLFSRRVVGWSADGSIDGALVSSALRMALRTREPKPGLLHHSDRGSQYASREYRGQLRARGIRRSMSRKGDCWDNAVAESFFATLKTELVSHRDYLTREQATVSIAEYIEVFYNCTRRHSALGNLSPVAFEAAAAEGEVAA